MTKVNDWSFQVNRVKLQGGGESTRPTGLRGVQEGMIQLVGARQVEILLVGIPLRVVMLRGTHILIELKHVSIIMNLIEHCQLTELLKNQAPSTLVTCMQTSSHLKDPHRLHCGG